MLTAPLGCQIWQSHFSSLVSRCSLSLSRASASAAGYIYPCFVSEPAWNFQLKHPPSSHAMRRSCSPLCEMISLALCPFLGVVILVCALGTQAAVVPYATYQQVFQYSDGSISTNQTAEFYLSDALPGGLIQVGEYTLQIQSLPPALRYRSREVARIPKSVSLHIEEVDLAMGDGQPGAVATSRTGTSASARRLLQVITQDLIYDPNMKDIPTTQVEYDQYQFITAPTTCYMESYQNWQNIAAGFIDGSNTIKDVGNGYVLSALEYLVSRVGEVMGDSHIAISNSWYIVALKDMLIPLSGGQPFNIGYAAHTSDNFAAMAKLVLNALWLQRDLTPDENGLLSAFECSTFPGFCYSNDATYLYTGTVYSNSANCATYKQTARTMALNFEHSSAYNLADGLASPLSTYFQTSLDVLRNSTNAQILLADANAGWAGAVGIALKDLNATLFAQGGINSQVQQLLSEQAGINAKAQDNTNNITAAVELIYSLSKNTTDELLSALQIESDRVDALNNATNNATNFKFSILFAALQNMNALDDAKFLQMYSDLQDISGLLQSTAAQFTSFVQQKQFNRLLTRQFYQSSDALLASGSAEIPLVSGDGIRPTTLQGMQLKALIDTVIVTSGSGAVHAVRLDFFADTYIMLNASRPWTTIEQLVMWIGVAPCVIRANASSPFNDTTTNYCTLWAEVVIMDCASGYLSGSNTCGGHNTTTSMALTTSIDLFSFFASLCVQSSSFTVTSVSLLTASFVYPVATTCNTTFHEKMTAPDRSSDPMIVVLTYVWVSYMQPFQTTMRSLELLAYGQLPNGVHTEPTSMGYSPGPISGVDGGRVSLQGMRAYWLSVHPDTLPVTSLTYVSQSSPATEVTVSLTSSPSCATNGNVSSACYSVSNSDLRTNWVFQDSTGVTLPSQMVVVGDITSPSFSAIYDVPLALIETTSNTLVRENLLTYLMMPAGVETTSNFDYFESVSNGLFSAKAGSASASDYQFPAVFDNDGYPVCNIDGGLPISSTYVAPVDNCVAPFVTSVPFFTGSYSLFGAPPVTPSAGVCSIAPPSPSQLNSVVLLYSQEARLAYPNGTLYFPPGASLSVSWSTQVEWSFSLWVNVLQSPAGQIGVTLWSGTLTVDGHPEQHNVQLRWGSCGTTQSDSGVLYLCVDAPNGFSVKVTTADYGTCITGSCQYPNTQLNGWSFLVITVSGASAFGYVDGLLTSFSISAPQSVSASFWDTGSLVSLPVTTVSDVFLVRSLKFYSWALTKQDIDTEMRCGQMTIVPRCWLPASQSVGTNLSWVPSSTVQIADTSVPVMRLHELRPSCLGRSSGTLVSVSRVYDALNPIVSAAYDALHPIAASWATTLALPAFTISFWMRRLVDLGSLVYSDGQSVFITTQLGGFTPGPPQQTLTLTLKRSPTSCVAFSWVNAFPAVTFNAGEYSSLLAEPTSHHYTMSISGQTAGLYLDGILQGFVGNSTCSAGVQSIINLSPGCDQSLLVNEFSPSVAGYSNMECTSAQLVRVYSGALAGSEIQEAAACERSSYSVGNTTALYEFPLAVCTLPTSDASVGYCRHKMMCQGHCAAYSIITTDRFTPLQIVCDSGWLPPTCATKCDRVDQFGECITQQVSTTTSVDLIADAFSPNGYWCMALKYFQAGAVSVNGQPFVDFDYRQYEYITDLTVPSGQIVSIVPAGKCPAVVLQQNGDASVWVVFTNVYANYTQLVVHVKSVGACSAPSICCDDTYPLVLSPLTVYNWNLPSLCAALQIDILLDLGNSQSLCQSLNTTTVASQLAASVTAPVVANVARSIVVTGNDVLNSMAMTNQQIVQFQFALTQAAYEAAMQGLDVRDLLNAAGTAISQVAAPTLSDAPVLTNPFDSSKLQDILTTLTNGLNASANAVGNQAADLLTLVSLGAQFNALLLSTSTSLAQQQTKLDILQHQTNVTNTVMLDGLIQMRDALIAFGTAIPSQVDAQIASSGGGTTGSLSTGVLVLLCLGSVMGALAASAMAWPFIKDMWYSFTDSTSRGHHRHRVADDGEEDRSPSDQSEYAQSNVSDRVSREASRMTQPHLYS